MISKLLDAITSYSWEVDLGVVSIMLFGEYPYPQKCDYDED